MSPASEDLMAKWHIAADKGILRTNPGFNQWRSLSGALGLVVMYNPLHRPTKRPVDDQLLATTPPISTSLQSGFNFSRAKRDEFLCALEPSGHGLTPMPVHGDVDWELPRHAVLVNISPLMYGHLLCVFDLPALRRQVLDFETIKLGFDFCNLVSCEGFYIGFNGAGAWSSVNHCHFQGYWMNEVEAQTNRKCPGWFPIVRHERVPVFMMRSNGCQVHISRIKNWPVRCFVLQCAQTDADDIRDETTQRAALSYACWRIVNACESNGTAFNILMYQQPQETAIIFPRQRQQLNGSKRFMNAEAEQLRFAIAELAGLVVAGGSNTFLNFEEADYLEIMEKELSVDEATFARLVKMVQQHAM